MLPRLLKPANHFLFFSLFLLAIFAGETVQAQIKFTIVCQDRKIGKNDLLQIQFKLENASNVESIIPPVFNGFTVVNGPNQESSTSIINGQKSQYVSIGFFLQPKSTGSFTIGSAKAKADGQEFSTSPIKIEVLNETPSGQPPVSQPNSSPFSGFNFDYPEAAPTSQFDDFILKEGENADEKIRKNIFVKLDVNKTSCYVGEPITASYKLYTRLNSESTITEAPSFNGFSVSDFDVVKNSTIENLNGRKYNVYVLRKVQLYPLQSGDIVLDPVASDNKVTFLKGEYANARSGAYFYDLLNDFANNSADANSIVTKNVKLTTAPITIHVKALPAADQPKNFKGAVGSFAITAAVKNNNLTTDDAGSLQVMISGSGNIQLVNPPQIVWPEGIEHFDANVKDDIDKSATPMKGNKVFTFPFVISKEGNYSIDSISFSYFDPATSSYKMIKTKPIAFSVTKGVGLPKNNLKSDQNRNPNSYFSTTNIEMITGVLLLLGLMLSIFWAKNKRVKNKSEMEKNLKIDELENKISPKETEFEIPENILLEAHQKLIDQDHVHFFPVLHSSLKKYFALKFKIPQEEITRKVINEQLDLCNVSMNTSLMTNQLLDDIELNLYAKPDKEAQLCTVFERASEVVSLLDKQVCK
ncbi:MAG: BatD family protein [Ginsengibacter sp.]